MSAATAIEFQMIKTRLAVRDLLVEPNFLSDAEKRTILRRYTAGVAEHFVKWLAAASLCSRSLEARYAAGENARLEIADDHPGMLREFSALSGAVPDREDYEYVEPFLDAVQSEVAKMPGLFLTVFLGVLESTSAEYIPWLTEISKSLGNTNFRYAEIHGEADISHAEQFNWAAEKESKYYENPDRQVNLGHKIALYYLKGLLTIKSPN